LDQSTLIESLQTAPVLLLAFLVHERRRAYAALRQGDPSKFVSFASGVFAMAISLASPLRDLLMNPVPSFALGAR